MLLAIIKQGYTAVQSCIKTMSSRSNKEINAHWKECSKGRNPKKKQGGLSLFLSSFVPDMYAFSRMYAPPIWAEIQTLQGQI